MQSIKNRATAIYLALSTKWGQGYTEYVILLGLIALVAYAAVQTLGSQISNGLYNRISPSV